MVLKDLDFGWLRIKDWFVSDKGYGQLDKKWFRGLLDDCCLLVFHGWINFFKESTLLLMDKDMVF
jgi:hypothetical protein